jgi:trans-aconitate methyltransferase
MEIAEAKTLIAGTQCFRHGRWAELGCGGGTFTYALAELLPAGSSILAIDREPQRLRAVHAGISIAFRQADLATTTFDLTGFAGILAANFLHFLPDPENLIARYAGHIQQWVVVEYEDRRANPWVPWPLPFARLRSLFTASGYQVEQAGLRASAYGGKLYGAHAIRG